MTQPTQRRKRISVIVSVDLPPEAKPTDIMDYVRDAVTSWWGQFEPPGGSNLDPSPGHPLWRLNKFNITVTWPPQGFTVISKRIGASK